MSLQKIGNLTNTFKNFKSSPFANMESLVTSLSGMGDINKAAKYLKANNSDDTISDRAASILLFKAYKSSTTKEAAAEAYNTAGSSSLIGSLFGGAGLKAGMKAAGSGIMSVLSGIAPVIGTAVAVGIAAKLGKTTWDEVLTNNAAKKRYQASSQKYTDAKSELDDLQSQYDTNQDRIYELRAKENRSTSENAELSQLRDENTLLKSQVSVKSELASASQKQAALDAKTALEKTSLHFKVGDIESVSDLERAENLIKEIQTAQKTKTSIENNRAEPSESYFSDYQQQERDIASYDKTISKDKETLADLMSTISKTAQDFWKEDGSLVDKSTSDTAQRTKELLNNYSKLTDPLSYTDDKINNILALDKFKDVEKQLSSVAKNGTSKDVRKQIGKIKGLRTALSDAGITTNDLADYIMSTANPDRKSYEGIMDNFSEMFGKDNKRYKFFKDKEQKDVIDFWDYLNNNNLDPSTYDWNLSTLDTNWKKYLKSKESTPDTTSFSSLFKNATEDTATDIDTITDNFQSSISSIKSAMDSLKSGDMKSSDLTDLIQQFPELTDETDNLQQGLQKLTTSKASDAIGKIRDSVKDTTDPKKLAQADRYVQSIISFSWIFASEYSVSSQVLPGILFHSNFHFYVLWNYLSLCKF